MQKIILTQWLPASGKSTWARAKSIELDYAYISKDTIRRLMPWHNEKEIQKAETEMVLQAINDWEWVIIDNTHLNHKNWVENANIIRYREIAKEHWYWFEVVPFYTSLATSLERNALRKESEKVPEEVIRRMYKTMAIPTPAISQFSPYEGNWIPCVIVDLDWTLALHNWRSPYDLSRLWEDLVNERLKTLLNIIQKEIHIVFMSWRSIEYYKETKEWLKKNWFEHNELLMRWRKDRRADCIIKKELYESALRDKWFKVLCVFDDRQQVVDMWRIDCWLLCCQVNYWNF